MTTEQIEDYEYCKKHLSDIEKSYSNLPFKIQKYGCGTGVAKIEHELERIHRDMYNECFEAINKAKSKINGMIEKL